MATEAKVIIKGQNNIGPAIKSASSDLSSMKAAADKLGAALKSAFAFTAIVGVVKKLGSTLSGCFSEFETADRAYKQLAITLGDDTAYKSATNTITKLTKQTLSSKGDIEAMVSELAALGKSSDEIDRISSAAVYLSNVTGQDLNSAMTTLTRSMDGNTASLRKYGIDVGNLTKEQLQNGAAIDLVIGKFGELSEAMAEASASQSLKNIKDTLGDIRQGFGQLVSAAIAPALEKLDEGLENFRLNFQNAVDNMTIMIRNFPEVFSHVVTLLKGMFTSVFEWENIKTLLNGLMDYMKASFQLGITNIGNLLHLFLNAIPDEIKSIWNGVRNYGMYIITNLCNDIGLDLSGLINSIGKWLLDSPIGQFVDSIITNAVNGIRLVGALIRNIPSMFDLVVDNIGTIVSNLWTDIRNGVISVTAFIVRKIGETFTKVNIPQKIEDLKVAFKNVFGNIGGWLSAFVETAKDSFRYIGDVLKATFSWDTIKNSALSMIESFCNFFIDAINSLIPDWFSKIPGLKEVKGISRVSLVDEDQKNPYAGIRGITKVENTYKDETAATVISTAGQKLEALADKMSEAVEGKSDWSDITKQFSELLSPVFEEYSKESESIGQTLATWTQKSASEYLKKSKESFSSVGSFLTEWSKDFVEDNKEGLSAIISTLSDVGESIFGDDLDAFTTWMDNFLQEQKAAIEESKKSSYLSKTTTGTSGSEDDDENPFNVLKDSVKPLISALGIFGDMINGMNPWIAVLKTILEGFVSVTAPAIKAVMSPVMDALTGIGTQLAMTIMPILDAIAPILEFLGRIISHAVAPVFQLLSPVVELVAAVFNAMTPIIALVGKAFTILMSPVQFVADLFSWLGSWLKFFGECVCVAAWNITHWFDQRSMPSSPGGFSSDAFTGLGDRLAMWDTLEASNGIATEAANTATQTAISSAGYQGGTHVTINIYQEAPVVGDMGMKAFASMIRDEFEELNYFGVTG